MKFPFIPVIGIGKLASDLPDKRLKLIIKPVFAHIIKGEYFVWIGHKVSPNVMMNGNYHLAAQSLGHAEYVNRSHLVHDADRVFSVGTESHVDLMILPVFRVIN